MMVGYKLTQNLHDVGPRSCYFQARIENYVILTRLKKLVVNQCEILINNLLTVALDHHRH